MTENMKKCAILTFATILILILSITMVCTQYSYKSTQSTQIIVKNENSILKINQIENSETIKNENFEKTSPSNVTPLLKQGKSSIVIEQSSQRVLFGDGENQRCYPASTTKILTAYIVLNTLELDRIVTISKEASTVEGSSLYLKCGDEITVEDLLYGLMLRSGNDCATALALEACGSIEDFASLMNITAMQLGAKNSHFVNPHGLHDDLHYTTAYDLALITSKAYENEKFVEIVSTAKRKITVNGEARYIANKNKLLANFEGANGVKTGYTKKSGRCLVGGAKRDGMQLISVVLNCPDMWNETVRMLESAFDEYMMIPLDKAILQSGNEAIKVHIKQNVTPCWKDIYYPVRRDGSERIEIVSDIAPFSFSCLFFIEN